MKRNKKLIALILLAASATAHAGHQGHRNQPETHEFHDYARVVHVKPIYKFVQVSQPRQECWDEEQVHYHHRDAAGPTIVGGIIGGAVGNRIGHGRGRDAATVAGAILGAALGRDIHRRRHEPQRHVQTEQVCRSYDEYVEEERLDGYRVKYRYHGRTYVTRMDHDPGDKIRVYVSVSPAE